MKKVKKEKENEIKMTKPAFRREHVRLIKLLRTSKNKKFRDEAADQAREMKQKLRPKESRGIREGIFGDIKGGSRSGVRAAVKIEKKEAGSKYYQKDTASGNTRRKDLADRVRNLRNKPIRTTMLKRLANRVLGRESDVIFVAGIRLCESKLTAKGRKHNKAGNFALAGRKCPIHDLSHARGALARVAQHGTPEEQKAVRAAVARKYPQIAQEGWGGVIGGAIAGIAARRVGGAMYRGVKKIYNKIRGRKSMQEGMIGNATRKVGGALWKHSGDIAATALGEAFGSPQSGLMSRIAVAKGGKAGQAMKAWGKQRQAKQTLKQAWKDKLIGVRKSIGG